MDIFDGETKMCEFMTSDYENFQYSPLFNDQLTTVIIDLVYY